LLRGLNPRNFPVLTLGLGYAWETVNYSLSCTEDHVSRGICQPFSNTHDTSGPYLSLVGAWLFHPGTHGSGFAIGPMVRADAFYGIPADQGTTWSLTAGMEIGFGYGRSQAR
jgi:hypothetical protein